MSFWWKVSSETNRDSLRFFVNGVEQANISGEVDGAGHSTWRPGTGVALGLHKRSQR